MIEAIGAQYASDGDCTIAGGETDARRARLWLLRGQFDAAAELLLLRERGDNPTERARLGKEIIAITLETMDLVAAGGAHSTVCLCQPLVTPYHSPLA